MVNSVCLYDVKVFLPENDDLTYISLFMYLLAASTIFKLKNLLDIKSELEQNPSTAARVEILGMNCSLYNK